MAPAPTPEPERDPSFVAASVSSVITEEPYAAPPGTSSAAPGAAPANDRPEILVGAAFAGGMVAAMILRRFGR